MNELRQKSQARIQAKFRSALRQMYEAFEEAYTLEQPELIEDLREHLVKPAIAQITCLFVSSRCRTCYSGRHQSAVWRLSRFDTLVPIMSEVPSKAYKKAEDHQAITILEKTRIEADGHLSDQYKLGLSDHDKRIFNALLLLFLSLSITTPSFGCQEDGKHKRTLHLLLRLASATSHFKESANCAGRISYQWHRLYSIGTMNATALSSPSLVDSRCKQINLLMTISSSSSTTSNQDMKEFINSVTAKSASLSKLLPVRICNSTILGLVDSGNSFYNAMSSAVATRIGLTYYQPYKGPPVRTAALGSTLDIVGIIKNTTFTLIDESGKRHPFSSRLVIVKHLSCRLNISLPFLVENGLDQLHSQSVLLWRKKQLQLPLYRNMAHARKSLPKPPMSTPIKSVITLGNSTVELSNKNRQVVPPRTGKLINATVPGKTIVNN